MLVLTEVEAPIHPDEELAVLSREEKDQARRVYDDPVFKESFRAGLTEELALIAAGAALANS